MHFFVNSSELSKLKTLHEICNSLCTNKCRKEAVDGKLQCKCGEDTDIFDWVWHNEQSANIRTSKGGREILFHPIYSSGTAAVRGQLPFQQNYHYYWEIKIISKLYGTDFMIGVGTSKVIVKDWQFKFCSLLGFDSESWGYSYHGNIQHNILRRKYGIPFGLGSIIGVHLNMCDGTLEYFLNRKPLGIAFKDLKGKELYPMVCSTAAQSSMRITCCVSKESSLQMMSLKCIMDHPDVYNIYKNIPGLTKIYDKQFFWMQPQIGTDADEKKRLAELDEDVALSLVDRGYIVKNKRLRSIRLISLLYEHELETNQNHGEIDIYGICDLDLAMTNGYQDQTDGPSTSGRNRNSPDLAESSMILPIGSCLYNTNESEGFMLRRGLDDSDTDTDTPGTSEII